MKAVVVSEPGGPEVLQLTKMPKPSIKEGWSLIKVKGFGINHSEIFTRQGLSPDVAFPRILGIECVGIVEESKHFTKGQTVVSFMGEMGRSFDGSYAEYVLLPNQQIYPITTNLSWEVLATIPETYYTAFGAMKNLRLQAGDSILVRGASSGVGLAFMQLVKATFPDILISGSSRSLSKEKDLLEQGFDSIIADLDGVLQTKQGFDKVLELIGPKNIKNTLKHVNEGGIVCSCGQLGNQWYLEDFDPIMELSNNLYLTTFYSGNVSAQKVQELFDYIAVHQVPIQAQKIFSLDEIAQAHRYIEEAQSFGKVVVLV